VKLRQKEMLKHLEEDHKLGPACKCKHKRHLNVKAMEIHMKKKGCKPCKKSGSTDMSYHIFTELEVVEEEKRQMELALEIAVNNDAFTAGLYGWRAVSGHDHLLRTTDRIEVEGDPFPNPPTKACDQRIDERLSYQETLMWQQCQRAMAAYNADPYKADLLHLTKDDFKTPSCVAFTREDLWRMR